MKLLKKMFAIFLIACMCMGLSACADQTWSVRSGDVSLSMGSYICFLSEAYSEASKTLGESTSGSSSTQSYILNKTIEDKKVSDWVKDKAIEECKNMISIEKKFQEMDLSLTEDEIQQAQMSTDRIWAEYGKAYEKLGVSKDSYNKAVNLLAYKKQKLFEAIYGIDGTEAVSDEELLEYYKENNANVSIMKKSLTKTSKSSAEDLDDDEIGDANKSVSPESSSMTDEEIEVVKNKFEKYESDINSGSKTISNIGETFKSEENLETDPVNTRTISLKTQQSTYSLYPDEVIEAIKSLETSKAKSIRAEDNYYLIVKNNFTSEDLEKNKTDPQRLSVLYEMKNEDFENMISDLSSSDEYQINNSGINKHGPSIFEKNSKNK